MIAYLESHNPFRSFDWRWELAGELVADDRRPRDLDDLHVEQALQYRRGLDASARSRRRAIQTARQVHAAHQIYREDGPLRWELEARLLTGMPTVCVATDMDMVWIEVNSYAKVFFDVPGNLQATDWIRDGLYVGNHSQWSDPDEAAIWRVLGWYGGVIPLNILIADYHGGGSDRDRAMAGVLRDFARFICTPIGDHERALELATRGREALDAMHGQTQPPPQPLPPRRRYYPANEGSPQPMKLQGSMQHFYSMCKTRRSSNEQRKQQGADAGTAVRI